MREVKFRAWSKSLNKILEDIRINSNLCWDKYAEIHIDIPSDSIFLQYTGLEDKNGKEIYEGDVLIGHTSYELDSDNAKWIPFRPAIVEWDERVCGFYPFYVYDKWQFDLKVEIIGNIYENPELVKSRKV